MNQITRHPLSTLGYHFIKEKFLPDGQDEYYLRNRQNRSGAVHRHLNAQEIEILVRNRNQSDDWNKILVSDAFNPELVKNCKFFGLIRIGKLEAFYLEYHNLRMPVGIYNSTIISCDLGDNVVIDNVNYLSHYIIGNDVVLVNVKEMATTNYAKFGNGIVKEGEEEEVRIWLEICNENGGRKVAPFSGMLPGDAWLWSRYRTDHKLQNRLLEFTQKAFDDKRGYYGKVGDRCIIKNSLIIKDVWIGSDAYIKGANKLKNLTIHSTPEASSQVGEGCEMVNGIVSEGCTVFYGVKAVRFVMASHSQLKYGARLINSYLGSNATISCCEVLNSLIFPAHEQHHNNSFLCAALILGQSNMAAGATVGSNHNSRGADGEVIAGRGFWPGLCVSLKHNSRFASFNILAKGDYPAELDIPLPFSLISNDESNNALIIMPAYWFLYNMYALARNAWKYQDRDKRIEKFQLLEFDYLAPDSMQEVQRAINILEEITGKAFLNSQSACSPNDADARKLGKDLLEKRDPLLNDLNYEAERWENSRRKVKLVKVPEAWNVYKNLIKFYALKCLLEYHETEEKINIFQLNKWVKDEFPGKTWINVGGQLMTDIDLNALKSAIKKGEITSWQDIHDRYKSIGKDYLRQKTQHALALMISDLNIELEQIDGQFLNEWIKTSISFRNHLSSQVLLSRKKDYDNNFRNMVYDDLEERDLVIGSLEDNQFIHLEKENCKAFIKKISKWGFDH
ncbi:MAG: DUF4954 family protein [Cyclobacteriaceae bacterium]